MRILEWVVVYHSTRQSSPQSFLKDCWVIILRLAQIKFSIFFLRLTAVKSPTYKLSSFEVLKMQTCFHVSNHVTCLAHSHVRASSASSCAFVYFNAQYCIEHSSTVSLFQARFARGYLH